MPERPHTIEEAVPLMQKVKFAKFDETVEMAMRLGVDPKHADQMVRGTVVLPHGLGKSKKVLAIAGADKQREATGGRRRSRRRRRDGRQDPGRLDGLRRRRRDARHDARRRQARQGARPARADAEPEDRHRHDGHRQGRAEIKAGKVEFRVDKTGIVHAPVGKISFPAQSLIDNAHALVDSVVKAKPSAAQGQVPQERDDVVDDGPGDRDRHDARDRSGEALVMAVTRADKVEELNELERAFKGTESAIVVDYRA